MKAENRIPDPVLNPIPLRKLKLFSALTLTVQRFNASTIWFQFGRAENAASSRLWIRLGLATPNRQWGWPGHIQNTGSPGTGFRNADRRPWSEKYQMA